MHAARLDPFSARLLAIHRKQAPSADAATAAPLKSFAVEESENARPSVGTGCGSCDGANDGANDGASDGTSDCAGTSDCDCDDCDNGMAGEIKRLVRRVEALELIVHENANNCQEAHVQE